MTTGDNYKHRSSATDSSFHFTPRRPDIQIVKTSSYSSHLTISLIETIDCPSPPFIFSCRSSSWVRAWEWKVCSGGRRFHRQTILPWAVKCAQHEERQVLLKTPVLMSPTQKTTGSVLRAIRHGSFDFGSQMFQMRDGEVPQAPHHWQSCFFQERSGIGKKSLTVGQ